jgi:hypothetical protein
VGLAQRFHGQGDLVLAGYASHPSPTLYFGSHK